jgi:hypothetical protein
MVKRAARKGLDLIPHPKDDAETKVFLDGVHIGNVRVRYTPELTFDAWRFGRLVYGGAPTLIRAAEALVDVTV